MSASGTQTGPIEREPEYEHPDSLDAAWADAEAALPKYWELRLERSVVVGPPLYEARAKEYPDGRSILDEGDTPTAALRALAQRLREAQR